MRLYLALIVFTLVSTTCIVACSKSSSNNSMNNNKATVTMKNLMFSPVSLQVTAGTTVTWSNNDNATHTVTADDGSFDSGNISPGGTFTHTFSSTGTIPYHCKIHSGMTGTVVVIS